MKRRTAVGALAGLSALHAVAVAATPAAPTSAKKVLPNQAAQPLKVLRYAFVEAETNFDPARISDLYSRIVTAHIFESLYTYDHLARPPRIRPAVADGMPEPSSDFRTWTVRLKRGIRFADDPVFTGKPREVVAADFVYAYKRFADPANNSPARSDIQEAGIVGLQALRDRALRQRKSFDYDTEIEGMRALDRYTLQFKLEAPRPRFWEKLAAHDLYGAVAREVVEAHGDAITEHPVGSGPFKLVQWRRSSLIALERNTEYREVFYDAWPAADDTDGQALLARFKGQRLPMVDRVEISIIQESQPRWLAFLGAQTDQVTVPLEFVNSAVPGGRLAPYLAQRGVWLQREVQSEVAFTYFNMEDPVVGGYTSDKIALRRAIALAMNVPREIATVRRGQAIAAQSPLLPYTSGYDPAFKCEMGDYDPARAKALLDMYGYVDRDGDGFREQPSGKALTLQFATQSDSLSRIFDELLQRSMEAVGIRVHFEIGQWPEQLKQAHAGKLMLWQLGTSSAGLDGLGSLQRYASKQVGSQNFAHFKLPAFERLYEQLQVLDDGPERNALFLEAKKIAAAYMPYKYQVHRIGNDLTQPWLIGFRNPIVWNEWWHMVDIDESKRPKT